MTNELTKDKYFFLENKTNDEAYQFILIANGYGTEIKVPSGIVEEAINYEIISRERHIDNLINYIAGIDIELNKIEMKEYLELLIKSEDNFIFVSLTNNEIVMASEDYQTFNHLCEKIIFSEETINLNKGGHSFDYFLKTKYEELKNN